MLIGRPLDLPTSALIQQAFFGRLMDIPWIWISCGYQMGNPQDVQWVENAIWDTLKVLKQNENIFVSHIQYASYVPKTVHEENSMMGMLSAGCSVTKTIKQHWRS